MNSPRPSISGLILNSLSNHTNDTRMTSVNEEEDEPSKSSLTVKEKDPRSCNERSDSGFSECSNCSTPSASCVCNLTLLDKNQSIVEEQSSISSNEPESENTESMQPQSDEKTAADESTNISSDHDNQSEASSLEYDDVNKSPCDDNQNNVVSIKVPPRRELFQDEQENLLSEIARRKLSLESTSQRMPSLKQHEVSSEKLKRSNKVALLMEKFQTSHCSSPMSSSQTKFTVTNGGVSKGLSTNQTAFDDVKLFDVAKTSGNDVTNYTSNNSSSLVAKSNSPTRLLQSQPANPSTTFRLSSRVREVTERLSRPKQNSTLGNSTGSIMSDNSNTFARSKEFWKR